jgi:DNA-binding transcriptional LysR family regulator
MLNDHPVDVRRLRLLLELSRLGSMREVADELGVTTSTVSQQIAALAREVGTPLLEPVGRRVRLTPAGHRLADHAVSVLAAVDAARTAVDATAEPTGTLRVAGFATAIRRSLLPVVAALGESHPLVDVTIHEYEPLEAFDLLARDETDLALTYDYNLAPASLRDDFVARPLWTAPWGLGVPRTDTAPDLAAYADRPWIVNSRNTADEDAVRTLASLGGFAPRIAHWIDSLELVDELIGGGHGVGLLPLSYATSPGVHVLPITEPEVTLRAYAVVRRGRESWPLLRLAMHRLTG